MLWGVCFMTKIMEQSCTNSYNLFQFLVNVSPVTTLWMLHTMDWMECESVNKMKQTERHMSIFIVDVFVLLSFQLFCRYHVTLFWYWFAIVLWFCLCYIFQHWVLFGDSPLVHPYHCRWDLHLVLALLACILQHSHVTQHCCNDLPREVHLPCWHYCHLVDSFSYLFWYWLAGLSTILGWLLSQS